MQHLDTLKERQSGRNLTEMFLDLFVRLRTRESDVKLIIRHDEGRDLFAAVVVLEPDDAHFLDKARFAVEVLDLVGVDVLSVRVDDHVL